MKKKINKNFRITLICITVILSVIFSGLIYKEVMHPNLKEEKIALYSYKNNAMVNYKVFLIPNIVFANQALDEGGEYISSLVDYVQTTFIYEFSGDSPVDVKGNFGVVAVVEGFVERLDGAAGQETKSKTVWKKEFVLVPKTNFQSKEKSFSLKQDIPLKLADYDYLVKSINEVIKVNTNSKLTVSMNVEFKGDTDKGLIEEKISPSVTIPLNTNLFNISKGEIQDKPGAIEETKQVSVPVNKNKVIVFSVLVGFSIISMLFLIYYTLGIVKDPFYKQLDYIFKKHGSRLVALNGEIPYEPEKQNKVKTIDDLVRIADEIGKPIMYKHSPNAEEITLFCVFDNNCSYVFDLKDYLKAIDIEAASNQVSESKPWVSTSPDDKNSQNENM